MILPIASFTNGQKKGQGRLRKTQSQAYGSSLLILKAAPYSYNEYPAPVLPQCGVPSHAGFRTRVFHTLRKRVLEVPAGRLYLSQSSMLKKTRKSPVGT